MRFFLDRLELVSCPKLQALGADVRAKHLVIDQCDGLKTIHPACAEHVQTLSVKHSAFKAVEARKWPALTTLSLACLDKKRKMTLNMPKLTNLTIANARVLEKLELNTKHIENMTQSGGISDKQPFLCTIRKKAKPPTIGHFCFIAGDDWTKTLSTFFTSYTKTRPRPVCIQTRGNGGFRQESLENIMQAPSIVFEGPKACRWLTTYQHVSFSGTGSGKSIVVRDDERYKEVLLTRGQSGATVAFENCKALKRVLNNTGLPATVTTKNKNWRVVFH